MKVKLIPLILFLSVVVGTAYISMKLWKGHIAYPVSLQVVVDDACKELEHKGLLDKVAILAYDDQAIELGFYGKADPEVVEIVKAVIDRRALGTPLKVVENVTVETQ